MLTVDTPEHRRAVEAALRDPGPPPQLPFTVADYVDFYSSEQHATNVGRIFRPDAPAAAAGLEAPADRLPRPGRHGRRLRHAACARGRAGILGPGRYGPAERLDIEAEVGFVVGTPSPLGEPVGAADWREHVFGVVLVNDWSARDIQSFETAARAVPGQVVPHLGLALGGAARGAGAGIRRPAGAGPGAAGPPAAGRPALDLALEVRLNGQLISRPPAAALYWTPAQQLAHLTGNGASLRTGDLYASGTVSGEAPTGSARCSS